MTTKPKSRSAVTKSVNRGRREDRLHLLPVTAATMLKLAQAERRYFAGRPITELGARCMLAESRRNRAAYSRPQTKQSSRRTDYAWKWREGGPGRRPEIGSGQYANRLPIVVEA